MTLHALLQRLLAAFRIPKQPDPVLDEARASERLYPTKGIGPLVKAKVKYPPKEQR